MADDYESSDDAKALSLAQEREDVEYIGGKYTDKLKEEAALRTPVNFKEAFREARNRGDKTFEWQGKKYTTELASEKKPSMRSPAQEAADDAKIARATKNFTDTAMKTSDRSAAKADSGGYGSADRAAYNRATRAKMAADRKAAAGAGYKAGGSVKKYSIDGIAKRGKTRAKQK